MSETCCRAPLPVGRSRYLFHRGFRFWFYLLNCWTSKYVLEIKPDLLGLLTDAEITKKNEYYQSKLARLFTQYFHVCASCGECCWHQHPPQYAVDYLLLDRKDGHIHISRFSLLRILKWVSNFIQQTIKFSIPSKEEVFTADPCRYPCGELTEQGCGLGWGCRYVICVIYLCPKFCQLMTRQDFADYLKISFTYMIHVTISTHKVISRWKSLNKKPVMPLASRKKLLNS